MTRPETPETTTGGPLGKVVGKVKEVAGEIIGEDDLAREGRLQQAEAGAEAVARRQAAETHQLQNEQQVEAARQQNEIERRKLQTGIAESEREAELERQRQQAERDAAE